jgi:hypothetical protein
MGTPIIDGGYGREGLGKAAYDTYDDFAGVALGDLDYAFGSSISIDDGRIGQNPATGREYADRVNGNYQTRTNVIDPSEGANYSGGSDYYPGAPLMPSSAGLAELSMTDPLDGVSDQALLGWMRVPSQRLTVQAHASQSRLQALKAKAIKIMRSLRTMTPKQRAAAILQLRQLGQQLGRTRNIRRGAAHRGVVVSGAPTTAHERRRRMFSKVAGRTAKRMPSNAAQQSFDPTVTYDRVGWR